MTQSLWNAPIHNSMCFLFLPPDGGDVAPSLQEAQVDCLSNTECQYYWGEHMIDPGQVCIFDKANEKVSACSVSKKHRGGSMRATLPLMSQNP